MTYTFSTSFGDDTILAPCLQVLCAEIAAHPDYKKLTNLGEIGDRAHQGQGYESDHNPFVVHNGKHYVRAIDLGGDYDLLMRLRGQLYSIGKTDARLHAYGYLKGPDSNITNWPVGTGWHRNTGDEGHLHISVTQKDGNNPSPSGWVPALDSHAPWGLLPHVSDPLEEVMAMYGSKAEFEAAVRKIVRDEGNKGFNVRYLMGWTGKFNSMETFVGGVKGGYTSIATRAAAAAKKGK